MIFCFSGTGNSRYIARRIAEALQDKTVDLNTKIKVKDHSPIQTGQDVIVVAPTYAWRIPRIVSDWLSQTEFVGAERIWFVMDCGSEIGNAAKYNRKLTEQKHLCYMGTAQIVMPENYIAMFRAPQAEEARSIVERAEPTLEEAIVRIQAGQAFSAPRSNLYDRFMSGPVNPIFYQFFAIQAARRSEILKSANKKAAHRHRKIRYPVRGLYMFVFSGDSVSHFSVTTRAIAGAQKALRDGAAARVPIAINL